MASKHRKLTYDPTVVAVPSKLKVWKTIKIGTGIESGKAFYSILTKRGFTVNSRACNLLERRAFTVATSEEEVDLACLSVADLGFKKRNFYYYKNICAKALELGLELCPAEVGPQLRLQYPNQPYEEVLRIAIRPIRYSYGALLIFSVGYYLDDLYLSGDCSGGDDTLYKTDDQFVFRLPRR